MPTYTCLCCGHTQAVDTPEEVFEASWDVAPYFTRQPPSDFCSSSSILIHGLDEARHLHADAHANWKKHGLLTPIHSITSEEPNQDRN